MSSEPIAKPVPTPVRSLVASEVAAPDDETQPADTLDAQDACRVSRCGGWNSGNGFSSFFHALFLNIASSKNKLWIKEGASKCGISAN